MEILRAENLSFFYRNKYQTVDAVRGVSCTFSRGKAYAIVGKSGSGKTTLLSLLAGLELPSGGEALFEGTPTAKLNRDRYRRDHAAVIYQSYNLFPLLTAMENVLYSMKLKGIRGREAKERAQTELARVGIMPEQYRRFPAQMSGGEQQRVAIARAVAKNPKLLLCDEPTGALDYVTGKQVLKVLQDMCYKNGITVVMITHNQALAQMAQKIIRVKSGKVVDIRSNEPVDIGEIEY